ncbi:MAG: sugar phosphorylase [Candidatus Bathyarchaeota archaeon]|nr:sugar phosphorylase [Candidatus Bathyarchaeota archaeon]MCZ2845565.1 sugar phosphorylase [Candidatus Bathyarchaeota archaeon]
MYQMSDKTKSRIQDKLVFLYGETKGIRAFNELEKVLEGFIKKNKTRNLQKGFNEKDIILITYGDMIKNKKRPLQILSVFAKRYLRNKINSIHILPFFEYYSDRGFSIIDYKKADSRIGYWEDVKELKKNFKLMFDLVLNHISDKHFWFQEFLKGNPKFQNYFIWFSKDNLPPEKILKKVFRPRATPLLTKYITTIGEKYVWTTFPLKQIDLNFKNEEVLLEIIDIILFYIEKGADIIRLDAIAFVWKELGTNCVHLKQAHVIVQLLRDILDVVAPKVAIITETNVPHKENIEYWGDGKNEAQMVYNFSLPPLVVNSIHTGNSMNISKWADNLETKSNEVTFFNFLDTHDGIGVLGAKGILSDAEIEKMVERSENNGGFTGYRKNPDGTESPYEMNTTWWSIINTDNEGSDDLEIQIKRYLVSRSIALCLKGVPGIYLNGLLGAVNDRVGAKESGNRRDINRKNFKSKDLLKKIDDKNSRIHRVFFCYLDLIEKRITEKAFHPNGDQEILFLNDAIFSIIRTSLDKKDVIVALHNLSNEKQQIKLNENSYYDILSRRSYGKNIELPPYHILWLKSL